MMTDEQWQTFTEMVDDAVQYREPDDPNCGDCTDGHLCEDHAEDQRRAAAYEALLSELRERRTGTDRTDRTVWRITAADLDALAGKELTDDELAQFEQHFDNSTVNECVTGLLDQIIPVG